MKRVLCWGAGGLLALLLIALGTLAALSSQWNAGFEREVAALTAQGAVLDLAAFAPPQIPKEQDAAPIYSEAFRLLEGVEGDVDFEDLLEDPVDWGRVEAEVGKRRAGLLKLREATALPDCRHPIAYADGFEANLPHIPASLAATRVLKAALRVALERGDATSAAGHLRDLLALGNSLRTESMLVCQLVRYAILTYAFEGLQADRMKLPPETWKGLGAAFSAPDLRRDFSKAIECERAAGAAVVRNPVHPNNQLPVLRFGPFLKKAGTNHLRLMTRAVELSRLPFPEARLEEDSQLQELQNRKSVFHVLSALLMPGLGRAHARLAVVETQLLIARTVCMLKAAGSYPETLQLPDPITGKSLIYRREGKGFLLYTPGVDGIDDGGVSDGDTKDDVGIRVGN